MSQDCEVWRKNEPATKTTLGLEQISLNMWIHFLKAAFDQDESLWGWGWQGGVGAPDGSKDVHAEDQEATGKLEFKVKSHTSSISNTVQDQFLVKDNWPK